MSQIVRSAKRRFVVVATALAAAAGLASVATAPAHAAWEHCEAGWFCLYSDAGGTGWVKQFQNGRANLHLIKPGPGWDGSWGDATSSYWNRTLDTWYVHGDINCSAVSVLPVGAGAQASFWNGNWWNDRVSSLRPSWQYGC